MSGAIRRAIFAVLAIGIPVLWADVPYGKMMLDGSPKTFASTALDLADVALRERRGGQAGAFDLIPSREDENDYATHIILQLLFLALLTPLYTAFFAALASIVPRWLAIQWPEVWIATGGIILALSPLGLATAWYWLILIISSAPGLELYAVFWLLPGIATLHGVVAIAIGLAPRGMIARTVLGSGSFST